MKLYFKKNKNLCKILMKLSLKKKENSFKKSNILLYQTYIKLKLLYNFYKKLFTLE